MAIGKARMLMDMTIIKIFDEKGKQIKDIVNIGQWKGEMLVFTKDGIYSNGKKVKRAFKNKVKY